MKAIKTAVALLLAAILLSGCSFLVPDEFKDGVKVDRNYPDNELSLYDNAVIFASDEDDGEITVSMGTEDELDDIIDFYQDFFDDEEIKLTDEDEGRHDYYAEGHVSGYDFKLNVEEPNGKWEEKLFTNVIEIVVTPAEDPVDLNQLIIGSWAMTNVALGDTDVTSDYWEYLLFTLYEDGSGSETYKWPYEQECTETFTWTFNGQDIEFILSDGSTVTTSIISVTEDSFIEKYASPDGFDTITYTRVNNAAWRPEYTTPPSEEVNQNNYYGDAAYLEDIYGSWVGNNGGSSLAIWYDGLGAVWDIGWEFGEDISWEYSDGLLSIYYNDDTQESFFVTYDGYYLQLQSEDVSLTMEPADNWLTMNSWQMTFSQTYDVTDVTYLDFYTDGSFYIYDSNYEEVLDQGYWYITDDGLLNLYDEDGDTYYYYNYEGTMLAMYNQDWSEYYEFDAIIG